MVRTIITNGIKPTNMVIIITGSKHYNYLTLCSNYLILIKKIMKNKLLLTIIFALLFNYLYATPQIRDRVFWNGLEYHSIPSVKLEEHFSEQEVMRLNQLSNEWNVTSNYRGYWFEFEIENDSLYLKGIVNDDEENIMESIIGTSDRKWMCHYSDTMYLGYDESMFDDAFWTMIYESEMTVVFKDGIVQWVKDNQSKSKYSQYDHNVLLFSEFIYCNTRWDELDSKTLQEKPVVSPGSSSVMKT